MNTNPLDTDYSTCEWSLHLWHHFYHNVTWCCRPIRFKACGYVPWNFMNHYDLSQQCLRWIYWKVYLTCDAIFRVSLSYQILTEKKGYAYMISFGTCPFTLLLLLVYMYSSCPCSIRFHTTWMYMYVYFRLSFYMYSIMAKDFMWCRSIILS